MDVPPGVAQRAFRLLQDWNHIPGSSDPGGTIEYKELEAWFVQTRDLLESADRREIGEKEIGKILAASPMDDDGFWPHQAIRELIEDASSSDIEIGFHLGITNRRGITSRGMDEGGQQEIHLAEKYEMYARSFADEWPRTAHMLREVAQSYRLEATSHDSDAERFRQGLVR